NIPGEEDKTKISWREFFRRDMAVIAASISQTDIWQIKKDYDELRAKLDTHSSHGIFADLFDPILGMAVKIEDWFTLAIPENPLYTDLQLAINSNLKSQMQKIVAYEEGFKYVDSKHPLNLDYSSITNKDLWGLNDTINADISIYQGADNEEKILNAALYVDDIFNSFYGFLSQLITNSESYMQFALEQYPAHQPHMALFIAFLQLFRLAQEQVNGITQRMLDFYYRDVLHLTAKPFIPDKVHIVFELAKDVAEYDVVPGTALKAGKDASGKDQIYTTETDLVVNQAKVKEIKNIFIDKTVIHDPATKITTTTLNSIYAHPVAKSQDGLGEKFTDPANTKWLTFGKGGAAVSSNNICDQVVLVDDAERKDQAQIGFAIASPQLVLQGGNRLIALQINDLGKLLNAGQTKFEISLTSKDGWLKIDNSWFSKKDNKFYDEFKKFIDEANSTGIFNLPSDLSPLDNGYLLGNNTVYVYLPIAAPAIIAYNAKLHPGSIYNTPYPVMQILIGPDINIDSNDLNIINDLSLSVKVGSINPKDLKTFPSIPDGLKTLTLQNELGLIATGKPFDPFTAYPFTGNSFYIGSDEVFNKPLTELAINIQHVMAGIDEALDVASSESELEIYKVYLRERKQWDQLSTADGKDFTEGALTTNILFTSVDEDGDGVTVTSPHLV
ncbi:MAG TPA: hypothetical protein VK796_09755, partial [Cytophaga sp.]|nr:hypothetical protein [Cytophaga sp.]